MRTRAVAVDAWVRWSVWRLWLCVSVYVLWQTNSLSYQHWHVLRLKGQRSHDYQMRRRSGYAGRCDCLGCMSRYLGICRASRFFVVAQSLCREGPCSVWSPCAGCECRRMSCLRLNKVWWTWPSDFSASPPPLTRRSYLLTHSLTTNYFECLSSSRIKELETSGRRVDSQCHRLF